MNIVYPIAHITRPNFLKIRGIDIRDLQAGRQCFFNLNRMIWNRDIYQNNEQQLKVVYEQPGYRLEKLEYANHVLFFLREKRNNPFRDNLFWINSLSTGTYYENHKEESMILYRFGDMAQGVSINKDGKQFTAVLAGHVFVEYTNDNLNKTEGQLWQDFQKSVQEENRDSRFMYSEFGKYLVVYKYIR